MDRRVLPGRIADVIAEVHPDVIGLQEVVSVDTGHRELHQARYLAESLGMNLELGRVRELYGGVYGNVVLSRFPIRNACAYDLSAPGRERRGCLRADVDLGNNVLLHFFNMHLGTGFLERRWQAQRLVESQIIRGPDLGPRVVAGDFNEWTAGMVSRVLAAEFRTADIRLHLKRAHTYPGVFPVLHLDHIYYDEDLIVEKVVLHRTMKSLVASDHLPLYADFGIKGT
jgi:endonuclease/exonuclease/phosphatase family metal-dependent hydrolase